MCKYNIPTKYLATAPIPPPINIEKTFNIYTLTLIKSSKMSQASETNFEQCSFLALPSKPELKTLQQVTLFNFTNRSTSWAAFSRAKTLLLNLLFLPKLYPKTICAAQTAPQIQPDYIPPDHVVAQGNKSGEHIPSSAQAWIILSEHEYPFLKYFKAISFSIENPFVLLF